MKAEHIRKPYLAYAELTTFIIASVCNSLILQANVFIDAVIVGNYVSTDAMAIINLFAPLLILVTMVPMLLAEGSMVAGSSEFSYKLYLKFLCDRLGVGGAAYLGGDRLLA